MTVFLPLKDLKKKKEEEKGKNGETNKWMASEVYFSSLQQKKEHKHRRAWNVGTLGELRGGIRQLPSKS